MRDSFSFFQNAEELVHVRHAAPAVAQVLDATGRLFDGSDCLRHALERYRRRLVGGNDATHEPPIGVEVGRRPQVDLVNRVAGIVEELQRAFDIVAVALLDRETVRPDFWEHPEVDMFAKCGRRVFAGLDLLVDADLFVDSAFVARQRHHLADGLETEEHVVDARFDAPDALADMGGDQFGL